MEGFEISYELVLKKHYCQKRITSIGGTVSKKKFIFTNKQKT